MKFFEKLKLNEEYIYEGSLKELEEELLDLVSIYKVEKVTDKEFKLKPFISWGTIYIPGNLGFIEGINVRASITKINNKKQIIRFTTKIRIEHFFFGTLFFVGIITLITIPNALGMALFMLGIWIFSQLWYYWIFRLQEKSLIKRAVKELGLVKK